ncbi:MAG: YkgJ family cysteine cluster protein [Bdellovibrionales bacterium]|nr:YkgJ family cysteine cluster protein [Bdellovibrionales bacterium]
MTEAKLDRSSPFSYRCNRCMKCCYHFRIRVSPYEASRLARFLGISTTEFLRTYTANQGTELRRVERDACVFLGPDGCTVHADRPLVCRLYPLGRHRSETGEEHFSLLEPITDSAGVYGRSESVQDYLSAQGADPFIDIIDAYNPLVTAALPIIAATGADSGSNEQQQLDLQHEILDIDAMLGQYASENAVTLPADPEARAALHRELLWELVNSWREEAVNETSSQSPTEGNREIP